MKVKKKYYLIIFLINICFLCSSCSGEAEKNYETSSRIKLVKVSSKKEKLERSSMSPNGEKIMNKGQYRTKIKEFVVEFEVDESFRVTESASKNRTFFTVDVIEKVKKDIYPANFSITHFTKPEKGLYEVTPFFNIDFNQIKKFEKVEILEQGQKALWDSISKYIVYSFDDYYPADKLPLKKIRKKVLITYVFYKKKLYKLEYTALEEQFDVKKKYYDLFVRSLKFF